MDSTLPPRRTHAPQQQQHEQAIVNVHHDDAAAAAPTTTIEEAKASTTMGAAEKSPRTGINEEAARASPVSAAAAAPSTLSCCYPDLLLHASFLRPFFSLFLALLCSFVLVRGMCARAVPDNCKLSEGTLLAQQVLASVERLFLVVAIGDFGFLWGRVAPTRVWWKAQRPVRCWLLHLVCVISAVVVSAALVDRRLRKGTSGVRILVAVVLVVLLLPPLIFCFVRRYTPWQRLKVLALIVVYIAFLIASAALNALHIHHWTWGWIYVAVLYPPHDDDCERSTLGASGAGAAATSVGPAVTSGPSSIGRVMDLWSRVALMIGLGILFEGLAAYGSGYFFISEPKLLPSGGS